MEVILIKDVPNLGDKDELVSVKPGYANNFLIPRGFAIVATKSAKKTLEENLRQATHKLAKMREEAEGKVKAIEALELKLPTLVGKGGKIYGSITTTMLANLLQESGYELDRRKISFDQDIKTTGSYTATVVVYKDVKAKLGFEVIEKEDE